MPVILGVIVLILLLWAASAFAKADPKQAAKALRSIGGGGALLFAGFLLFRGQIGLAIPVGAVGLGLLGWSLPWAAGLAGCRQLLDRGRNHRFRLLLREQRVQG